MLMLKAVITSALAATLLLAPSVPRGMEYVSTAGKTAMFKSSDDYLWSCTTTGATFEKVFSLLGVNDTRVNWAYTSPRATTRNPKPRPTLTLSKAKKARVVYAVCTMQGEAP